MKGMERSNSESRLPSEAMLEAFAGPEINLENKSEVIGTAGDIEFDIHSKAIDTLTQREIAERVVLAETLLPALTKFAGESIDADEASLIKSQLATLIEFIGTHQNPSSTVH